MCFQCGNPNVQRSDLGGVLEDELPMCMRDTLDAARLARLRRMVCSVMPPPPSEVHRTRVWCAGGAPP
jgi:hypothetical protein